MGIFKDKRVGIVAAKIGFIAVITSAIITSIFSLFNNKTTINANGDYVSGDKTVIQNLPPEIDLTSDSFKLSEVTDFQELKLYRYKIAHKYKLNKKYNGINGALLLLVDKNIEPLDGKLIRDSYSHTWYLNAEMVYSGYDLVDTIYQATILAIDNNLNAIFNEELGKPDARMDKISLYEDKTIPTFIITTNYTSDWGSYSGPISTFFEVREGKMSYILGKEKFCNALKLGWVLKEINGKKIIVEKECQVQIDDVYTYYTVYYNKRKKWVNFKFSKKGWWENGEGEDGEFYDYYASQFILRKNIYPK